MKIVTPILITLAVCAAACSPLPHGEVQGHAVVHTEASARDAISNAQLALPSSVTGGAVYVGPFGHAPGGLRTRVPVVVFLHGSSGLAPQAIAEWQRWLAGLGIASLAPNSFALPDRLTYRSPVSKAIYEEIHALRASEIELAVQALETTPWADNRRMVLAGISEGAVAVARYRGHAFVGTIIFSWSCEDNYFVQSAATAVPVEQPVLNVISASDPYFSAANPWLGNPSAEGSCARAFKDHKNASVVLIPGAPHMLLNMRQAREPVEGFLQDLLEP